MFRVGAHLPTSKVYYIVPERQDFGFAHVGRLVLLILYFKKFWWIANQNFGFNAKETVYII
jgi:hypothetical protein